MNRNLATSLGLLIAGLAISTTTRAAEKQPPARFALLYACGLEKDPFGDLPRTLEQRAGFASHATDAQSSLVDEIRALLNKNQDCQHLLVYFRGSATAFRNSVRLGGDSEDQLDAVLALLNRHAEQAGATLYLDLWVADADQHAAVRKVIEAKAEDSKAVVVAAVHAQNRGELADVLERRIRLAVGAGKDITALDLASAVRGDLNDPQRSARQAPVLAGANGVPGFITDRELRLAEAVRDLSGELARKLAAADVKVVAVVPVHVKVGTGTMLSDGAPGLQYGPLLRLAEEQFRRELAAAAGGQASVLSAAEMLQVLHEAKLDFGQIKPNLRELFAQLSARGYSRHPAIVTVKAVHMAPDARQLQLMCELRTPSGELASEQRTAHLLPSEWAMIGNSSRNADVLRKFQANKLAAPGGDLVQCRPEVVLDMRKKPDIARVAREFQALVEDAATPHPLADSTFPFRVELLVTNRDVSPQPAGPFLSVDRRHVYYDLQKGDKFKVVIRNRSQRQVFLRLLVDGQNTVPDYPLIAPRSDAPQFVEAVTRTRKLAPAPYVNLVDARPWLCNGGAVNAVAGFYTDIARQGGDRRPATYREFVVTDAVNSHAWQQGFRKDIGIVTAAFYEPVRRPKTMAANPRLGVKMGNAVKVEVNIAPKDLMPGPLLAVVHLRYGIEPDRKAIAESQPAEPIAKATTNYTRPRWRRR